MVDVQIGDIATMRKAHPCGSSQWMIYRVGADIGMRCVGCQHRHLMPRSKFEKAVKKIERPNASTHDS